jgi:hypothetical protein
MFGHHKRVEKKIAHPLQPEDYAKKNQRQTPHPFGMGIQQVKKNKEHESKRKKEEEGFEPRIKRETAQNAAQAREERTQARGRGRERYEEFAGRQFEGLTPESRHAYETQANAGIQRASQGAEKKLLGQQGQRGILGRSGVGYAQQRDLQRMASEERGKVQNDLNLMNEDLRERHRVQAFGVEEGEASQEQLDRRLAQDELRLADERKRQRSIEDQRSKEFKRL